MSVAAKVSKYRHTKGEISRPDKHFVGVQLTGAIWDCSNMMDCNTKYVAVPWASVGSTAVFRHDQFGKVASTPNMLRGHSGHVIDLAFHPFDDSLLFTASEDCNINGWRIPEGGLTDHISEPAVTLSGHGKKCGILAFHPSAHNVLASAGTDNIVNIWDVEVAKPKLSLRSLTTLMTSLNWNLDGSLLNTTTKDDKSVHVLDSRSGVVVASAESHQGSKTQRSVWAKRRDVIVTLGFDKKQHRQLMVWDLRNMQKPQHVEEIDQQSSVMMPFMDEDTNMLYVGGKGESSIRYYELWGGPTPIVSCATYSSTDPQKALAMLPKSMMDVRNCELARFYKVGAKSMHTISMQLPRKESQMEFQEDVYPPTFAREPAIRADEFFSGVNSAPKELDLRGLFDGSPLMTREPSSPVTSTTVAPVQDKAATDKAAAEKAADKAAAAEKGAADKAAAEKAAAEKAAAEKATAEKAAAEKAAAEKAAAEKAAAEKAAAEKAAAEKAEAEKAAADKAAAEVNGSVVYSAADIEKQESVVRDLEAQLDAAREQLAKMRHTA